MKIDSSKVIVFDTELTCWNEREKTYKSREIISLGACILDLNTKEIENKFHKICKAQRSQVSEYCTNLTGITQEQVDKGMDFEEMCKLIIKEFKSKSYPCAAWGEDDNALAYECRSKDCKYPFSGQFINISLLYSVLMSKPINNGLEKSLVENGLSFVGEKHDPYWDAYNAAVILKLLVEKCREVI